MLVAMPALDEAGTIGAVVDAVRAAGPYDVVVVDDGSTDATADIARDRGVLVLSLPFTVGVGGAMRTAFLHAQRAGYDYVVQVDADGQHDPTQIPTLLAAMSEASVVIGARFAGVGDYQVRGPRRWAMSMLARVLSRVTGTTLTDTTSGFRAADREAIALFAQRYPAEYLGDTVESLVIAARSGLRVRQVPVVIHERQGGAASQGPVRASFYLGRALLALAVALTRRPDPGAEAV